MSLNLLVNSRAQEFLPIEPPVPFTGAVRSSVEVIEKN